MKHDIDMSHVLAPNLSRLRLPMNYLSLQYDFSPCLGEKVTNIDVKSKEEF